MGFPFKPIIQKEGTFSVATNLKGMKDNLVLLCIGPSSVLDDAESELSNNTSETNKTYSVTNWNQCKYRQKHKGQAEINSRIFYTWGAGL